MTAKIDLHILYFSFKISNPNYTKIIFIRLKKQISDYNVNCKNMVCQLEKTL